MKTIKYLPGRPRKLSMLIGKSSKSKFRKVTSIKTISRKLKNLKVSLLMQSKSKKL